MSSRPLSLFGEEIMPEDMQAVGKSRAVKKKKTEVADVKETKKAKATKEITEEKKPDEILDGWDDSKKYYSIGEVATLFKVKTSHIRFWTNEFALKVRTTRKGDRLYTPELVKEIRMIYHLVKERGFTINGAKTKLKEQKKVSTDSIDLKQSLLQLRNKLVAIRNQL